eukprot:8975569-Alexandrium_andersonii.AAC.1
MGKSQQTTAAKRFEAASSARSRDPPRPDSGRFVPEAPIEGVRGGGWGGGPTPITPGGPEGTAHGPWTPT